MMGSDVRKLSQSTITTLFDGKLHVLRNSFPLDGRVSAYPNTARGHAVSNCYLLVEKDGALLLDTGAAIFESQILEQLGNLIDRDLPLSIFPLRINEYMSVGNAMAIAREFNVVQGYSRIPDIQDWLEFGSLAQSNGNELPQIPTTSMASNPVQVGAKGDRILAAFTAPIQLISTFWIYDPATRAIFTSDMFNHIWHSSAEGPWVLNNVEDTVTTPELVRSFLLNTRYWWLDGAALETIRSGVSAVFNDYQIETIAPGFGAVLTGTDIVKRQFTILDDVLREADRCNVEPYYVPRNSQR
ncbi:MAG: hypothetical protein ACR2PG_09825 [Hyphomicrobiaceae bacterium]